MAHNLRGERPDRSESDRRLFRSRLYSWSILLLASGLAFVALSEALDLTALRVVASICIIVGGLGFTYVKLTGWI